MAVTAPTSKKSNAGFAYILQGPFDKPLLLYGLESLVLATSFTAAASTLLEAFEVANIVRFSVLPPIWIGLAIMWLVLRIQAPTVAVEQTNIQSVPKHATRRPKRKKRLR